MESRHFVRLLFVFASLFSLIAAAQSNSRLRGSKATALAITPSLALSSAEASPLAQAPLFQHAVNYASGGEAAMSVAVADLNGDGIPDMVTANQNGSGEGTVGVLLGKGNGSFQPTVAYDSGGAHAWSVAVADLNGDHIPDIVVLNTYTSNTVGVLLGKGDGTFFPAVTYSANGFSIAIGDVNGDHIPDLVTGALQVLLGNGDGTFQPAVAYGSFGVAAVLADVNGDKKLDIVATIGTGGIAVLLGNGNGSFQAPVPYPTGGVQSYSVAVEDLNGDGSLDIAVSNYCTTGACVGDGSAAVLLGNGDGTFQPATSYDSGGRFAQGVAIGDVNGDGKPDLMIANYCQYNGTGCTSHGLVEVLLGDGHGNFSSPSTYITPGGIDWPVFTDINGGRPDLVVAGGGGVTALFGEVVTSTTVLTASPSPSSISQSVTLTAKITASVGQDWGGETVSFYDGANLIGSSITHLGVATLTTSFSNAGKHTLKAVLPKGLAFNRSVGLFHQTVTP